MANEKIQLLRGDTYTIFFPWTFPDGEAPDISTYKAILTVKKQQDADDTDEKAVIKKTLSEGALFSKTGDVIEMAFELSHEDTKIPQNFYVLNARLADANGVTVLSTENIRLEILLGATQGIGA